MTVISGIIYGVLIIFCGYYFVRCIVAAINCFDVRNSTDDEEVREVMQKRMLLNIVFSVLPLVFLVVLVTSVMDAILHHK